MQRHAFTFVMSHRHTRLLRVTRQPCNALLGRRTGTETVLHVFTGGSDGASPSAGLIADSNGNLYGTTVWGGASGYGTVFELTPLAMAFGTWREGVVHAFMARGDGVFPSAGLIADSNGNLYGTTYVGGDTAVYGTVFELTGTESLLPPPPPPKICAHSSSPLRCCLCAGGTWTGKYCF